MQELDWDTIFKDTLKSACDKTKKILSGKLEKKELIFELSTIANEFYKTFEFSPIPVDPPTPELYFEASYISASVQLPSGCFMVPYFFFSAFEEDNTINFTTEFSQTLPWKVLIGIINQKLLTIRKKLTKTDVLILKSLSRYSVSGQKFVFPLTSEILSNRTRQGISIVTTTFPTIYTRLIAQDIFLVNPWKAGWNLALVLYSTSEDDKYTIFDHVTLSKEFFFDDKVFRVIQQPTIHPEKEQSLLETIVEKTNGSMYFINKTSFHWDISDLQPREDESFKKIPDFAPDPIQDIEPTIEFSNDQSTLDWLQFITDKKLMYQLYSSRRHSFQDLDENNYLLRKKRILNIINFILKNGVALKSLEATAKNLDIPIHEFSKLFHFLIKSEIIILGHRFNYIGAGKEYSFIFLNGTKDDYHYIKQSLLKSVFSYFYEGDGALAGRCQVPDLWANSFLECIMKFRLSRPKLKILLGQRIYGYNFFTPNIRMPSNFVLDDFGIKELIQEVN